MSFVHQDLFFQEVPDSIKLYHKPQKLKIKIQKRVILLNYVLYLICNACLAPSWFMPVFLVEQYLLVLRHILNQIITFLACHPPQTWSLPVTQPYNTFPCHTTCFPCHTTSFNIYFHQREDWPSNISEFISTQESIWSQLPTRGLEADTRIFASQLRNQNIQQIIQYLGKEGQICLTEAHHGYQCNSLSPLKRTEPMLANQQECSVDSLPPFIDLKLLCSRFYNNSCENTGMTHEWAASAESLQLEVERKNTGLMYHGLCYYF